MITRKLTPLENSDIEYAIRETIRSPHTKLEVSVRLSGVLKAWSDVQPESPVVMPGQTDLYDMLNLPEQHNNDVLEHQSDACGREAATLEFYNENVRTSVCSCGTIITSTLTSLQLSRPRVTS